MDWVSRALTHMSLRQHSWQRQPTNTEECKEEGEVRGLQLKLCHCHSLGHGGNMPWTFSQQIPEQPSRLAPRLSFVHSGNNDKHPLDETDSAQCSLLTQMKLFPQCRAHPTLPVTMINWRKCDLWRRVRTLYKYWWYLTWNWPCFK